MSETKRIECSNRLLIILIVFAVGALTSWIGGTAYNLITYFKGYGPWEITVYAEGKAVVVPDVALVKLGVTSEGLKVGSLVEDNTIKMNAILKDIKDLGVAEKDIQTTNYSLTPRYDYLEIGERVFRGYTLTQEIRVKVRDFARIGDVLEKSTQNGANLVGDLQFTMDDMTKAKELAKKDAIAKAKAQAELLVKETGLKLGEIKNIYETSCGPYGDCYGAMGIGAGGGVETSATAAPTVQPGQQEVSIEISLVYQLK